MNAEIRGITEKEYYNDALTLWNECFPEDANGFSAFYYKKRSSHKYVLALFDSGKMVSMLHMVPYPVTLGGKKRDCRMVAGVATLKEYRGKGYAGMLLDESNKLMKEEGVFAAILQPFQTQYYSKHGYRPLSSMKECTVEYTDKSEGELFIPDAKTLLRLYDEYKQRYNAMMDRNEAYCELILQEAKTEGGFILCNGEAYAKGWLGDDEATICELVGENESKLIPLLYGKLGKLTVRMPIDIDIPCKHSRIRNFNMINLFCENESINDDDKINYSLEYY